MNFTADEICPEIFWMASLDNFFSRRSAESVPNSHKTFFVCLCFVYVRFFQKPLADHVAKVEVRGWPGHMILNSFMLLLFWRGGWAGARRQRHCCCSRTWQVMCWTSNYSKVVMPCGFSGSGNNDWRLSSASLRWSHYFRSVVDTHTSSEFESGSWTSCPLKIGLISNVATTENRGLFQMLPRKTGLISNVASENRAYFKYLPRSHGIISSGMQSWTLFFHLSTFTTFIKSVPNSFTLK